MAQIVIVSSLNSSTGKTLLTAHLAVMLAGDYKTAVADDTAGESPLAVFMAKRHLLNLKQKYNLPVPDYFSLKDTPLADMPERYDVILLDNPGGDYFPYADIVLTPLCGEEGTDAVVNRQSLYAALLWDARKKRAAAGKNAFRWVVVPNDDYSPQVYDAANKNSRLMGFALAPRLPVRNEYAKGLESGLTVIDKDLPGLKTLFDFPDLYARRDLKKITDFIWQNK